MKPEEKIFIKLYPHMALCTNEIKFNGDDIYYVDKGLAIIYLNDEIFTIVGGKSFINLINIYADNCNSINQSVYFVKGTVAYKVNPENAHKIATKENLHECAATIISRNVLAFANHIKKIKSMDSYNIIKEGIYYYNKHKDELNKVTSLSNFLIGFTGVSKTRVMLILQELKKGQYINTDLKGKLINVHSLPNNF